MARLTSIAPGSAALHIGLSMAAFGLALGVVYAVGGFFWDMRGMGLNRGTAMAFGALIGMPLYLGAVGAASAALFAWVYNRVAAWRGGIRLGLEEP